jgi:hypothetical protein
MMLGGFAPRPPLGRRRAVPRETETGRVREAEGGYS